MARKYSKKRKGGKSSEKLQADFKDLEMIVEKINNDVKELKEQLQNSNDEASGVEDMNNDTAEEMNNDMAEDNENNEETMENSNETDANEKSLDDKKAEIAELISQAQNILYDGTNCDFKMKQKPCSTGKDTLAGFERSMDKLTDNYKADDLKQNIENYISKIKDQLNMKGGRKTRRRRKTRKNSKRNTKKRR